jgi:dynein heavy chain, axonemal
MRDTIVSAVDVDAMEATLTSVLTSLADAEKVVPPSAVLARLRDEIAEFQSVAVLLKNVRSPALRTRHWERINAIVAEDLQRVTTATVGEMMRTRVVGAKDEVVQVVQDAEAEEIVRRDLEAIVGAWERKELRLGGGGCG